MSRLPGSLRTGGYGASYNSNSNYEDTFAYDRTTTNDSEPPSALQPSSSRARRAGAYGTGMYGAPIPTLRDEEEPEPQSLPRPTSLERTKANRRSGGPGWSQRSPTRRPPGGGGGGGGGGDGSRQIEEVLRIIKQDWGFMTEEKCVPVQVALQFMDDSSLGLASRFTRFSELHTQLQSALRQIVNEQHQGFNSSIGRFHSIQTALSNSQQKIRQLKESLGNAKTSLSTSKPELVGLAKTSQNYDDMLMTLSEIEHLQGIPEQLEARISEKRFLRAVDLLQDALKTIRKPSMDEIGALSDLKVYLSNQEHSLTDILIEELHSHLYLKSPYCENRWKQHASSHVRGVTKDQANVLGGRQLYQFLDQLDTDNILTDDPTNNPEADTFGYVHLLVESLNSLGRLDVAVETIAQRLPVELFRVVEKCSNEIDQRYPVGLRTGKAFQDPLNFKDPARTAILNDLFGTLFARFEAIAEGHRVVHEVISGITKRDGTRGSSSLTSGFRELWKLYQSEIRSILHDYLSSNDDTFRRRNDGLRGNNVWHKSNRDKSKKMFKLQDMDNKSTDLTTEREDLQSILTSSVPGLVSDSKRVDTSEQTISNSHTDGSATGHRLLVEPNVFNMAILLPPSLIFLNRLKEVVPSSSDIVMSTLTSFLDDFLINVFLPQLDETIIEMCSQIIIEADAFQQDPSWQTYARKPIFRGTAKFYRVIEAFCEMLDILPHDQAFSQLIINQIVTYYDKSYGWFKAMVSRSTPNPKTGKRLKISADLTEDAEMKSIINDIMNSETTELDNNIARELQVLLPAFEGTEITEVDLVIDRRTITALSLLSTSMKWFASKIIQLRFLTIQEDHTTNRHSERYDKQRRWTLITAQKQAEPDHVFLPLTEETAGAFDGVHHSYLELSTAVLRMLHVEIRGHVYYYVNKSFGRTFHLDQEMHEPDPDIVALNSDLVRFDEELSTHLNQTQQSFITTGIAAFLEQIIVSLGSRLTVMNTAGCSKMQLNILVLQQNLKNVEPNATLTRSRLYFDLFSAGPKAIIAQAEKEGRGGQFSANEMKALLQLFHSEGLRSERREANVAAQRGLEAQLLQLSEFIW